MELLSCFPPENSLCPPTPFPPSLLKQALISNSLPSFCFMWVNVGESTSVPAGHLWLLPQYAHSQLFSEVLMTGSYSLLAGCTAWPTENTGAFCPSRLSWCRPVWVPLSPPHLERVVCLPCFSAVIRRQTPVASAVGDTKQALHVVLVKSLSPAGGEEHSYHRESELQNCSSLKRRPSSGHTSGSGI